MTEEERQRFLQAQLLEQQRGLGFSDIFNNMVIDPAKQGIQDIGNTLSNWWDNTQAVDIDIPNMQISSPMAEDIANATGVMGEALAYPYTNPQENYAENIEAPAIAAGQNADNVRSGLVDMAALMLKGEDASQARQGIYENLIGGTGNSLWSASSTSDYSPLALMGGAIGGIRRVGNAGVDMARAARNLNLPKVSDNLTNAVVKQNQIDANEPQINITNQNLNNELVEAVMANPETLSKLPTTPANRPEPLQVVHDAHRSYMERTGRPALTPDQYVQIQPATSAQVANAFENMEHAPNDPRVRASYDAMINETLDQYQVIKDTGLNIEFIPNGAKDPYGSPSELLADMKENNHLWVFPTDDGFGTVNSITDNPLLAMTDEVVGGKQLQANDVFRIVHDYFGHGLEGASFGARGEENAWLAHAGMYSDEARAAMTTETRGQNSWVNYGPHGEANRANQRNTVYADQKIGLLPDWTSTKPRGVNYVENYGQRTGGTQPTGSDASGVGPTTATGTGAAGDGLQPLQRPTITERGTLQLRHHSPIAGLETISPSQGGSNRMMRGDERYRRSHEGYVPRSYYGLNTGDAGGYSKEMNVGDSVYNVEIDADKVYDLTKDANNLYYEAIQLHPDDIKKQITAVERMIKDKGFSGYWNRGPMGMVAVIYDEIPTN
jgi:hypothetical protein